MSRGNWDVIVVGAGLGGMLAGAILAREGQRVLVLERDARVGGRIRSFELDGFVVDAGAYLWPNAHLDEALVAAGANDFCGSTIPSDQVMRLFVEGDGGRRLSFPWPGRGHSPAMAVAARVALGADEETFAELTRLWERLAALGDDEVESLAHLPASEALPRYAPDERVRAAFLRNVMLFGAYDPGNASFGECIRLRRRRVAGRPPRPECAGANAAGGVRALPLALERALHGAGATLRLSTEVDQIAIDAGRVRGVYAHGSTPVRELLAAPVVIANLPVHQLFTLIAPDHFPPWFVESGLTWRVIGGVIAAAFAFDGLPRLRATGEPDTFLGWTRLLMGPEHEFGGGLLWASHHSPRNAPPGKHLLQAMRLSPHDDIADARRVERVVASFDALVDEIYADAREKLLWSRSWVSRDGSEYMISSARRPPVQAPGVAGLYLVGETTDVPAVQMDAAALSALRCVELLRA